MSKEVLLKWYCPPMLDETTAWFMDVLGDAEGSFWSCRLWKSQGDGDSESRRYFGSLKSEGSISTIELAILVVRIMKKRLWIPCEVEICEEL